MSWKKNAFSYLVWMIYTLITGTVLVSLGSMFCVEAGLAAWWGIPAAALYMGVVGGIVFLLYKTGKGRMKFAEENHTLLLVAEALLAVGLLAVGLVLRVLDMGEEQSTSVYFEMAEVAAGKHIPQVVHGAAHFYVRLLHGIFLLLGNQYMAGIWLQVVLQLMASVVLYFVMRRLAGALSALVVFAFCMGAPFIVRSGLRLSPGMLYFLFLAVAAGAVVWLFGGRLRLPAFVLMGLLSALCCYVDIHGVLVLLLAVLLAFAECEGDPMPVGRRLAAAACCLLTAVPGLLFFFWMDAFLSGKKFLNVAGVWLALYQGEEFRLPLDVGTAGSEWEGFLLFGIMAIGIFGFWCDRERDFLFPYVLAAVVMMSGSCFGICTEEMPGFYALYLIFAMLAGVGAQQCFGRTVQTGDVTAEEWEEPAGEEQADSGEEAAVYDREEAFWAREEALKAEFQLGKGNRGQEEAAEPEAREGEGQEEATEPEAGEGEGQGEAAEPEMREKKKIRYLDNPLPLPKKHVKRVMDYSIQISGEDDFDYQIEENDDFDV